MSDENRCKTEYEVLAPAGSAESLFAAVNNGCDSVYLGLDGFNARMKAPNFTVDNIAEYVDFCHLFGVKVYVTVNTSVKNDEFESAAKVLFSAYKANVDGVIVTDLALLKFAASLPGNLDVVASTQLNCHDAYGARFLKRLGATTVVCARECTLKDIREIASSGVKVESFIHGALCVCQSGQCLFSSLVGGNSGNRGLCAQPCRNFYMSSAGKKGYLLSTADLNGETEYKDLLNNGVSVFKIEGRNRSAEYAGVCSRAFKQLFEYGKIDKQTDDDLKEVYSRGEMKYLPYLKGQNDGIIYARHPRHMGRRVGIVKNGKIFADCSVRKGDGFKVFDDGREICGAVALSDGKKVEAKFSAAVKDGMTVCRTSSAELCERVASAKRTVKACAEFVAYAGDYAVLRLSSGAVCVEVKSDYFVDKARTRPTTSVEIAEQLQKTGDSHTTITDIVVNIGDIFLAKSQINGLRRKAVELLEKQLVSTYNGKFTARDNVAFNLDAVKVADAAANGRLTSCSDLSKASNATDEADNEQAVGNAVGLRVTCCDETQLTKAEALLGKDDTVIYKPSTINKDLSTNVAKHRFVYLDLPSFADLAFVENLLDSDTNFGIVCHNVGHVEFAREHKLRYIPGRGMNVFNDFMLAIFPDRDGFVYSYELTLSECKRFAAKDGFVFVDGKFPLMQLVHCPFKAVYGEGCESCKAERLTYTDERGNEFEICRRRDGRCTFELFNGLGLSATDKICSSGNFLADFDENVIVHYKNLNNGFDDGYRVSAKTTSGRLFNKIN